MTRPFGLFASLWEAHLWLIPNEGTFKRATVITLLGLAWEYRQSLDGCPDPGHPAFPRFDANPEPGWRFMQQWALLNHCLCDLWPRPGWWHRA